MTAATAHPARTQILAADYFWAATVVARYAWHFSEDFPVMVPLSVRFRGDGA